MPDRDDEALPDAQGQPEMSDRGKGIEISENAQPGLVMDLGKPAETSTTRGSNTVYEPLNEGIDSIRLLILHPADTSDDSSVIRCELKHATFRDKPLYEALSYTWGSPDDQKQMFVNGMQVPARQNLYSALFHLRKSEIRVLWVDAVCIDQTNTKEREYQVGLMSFIYSRASCVVVWLGPFAKPAVSHQKMKAVQMNRWPVANKPYWKRLWVIQEFALAREIELHFGGYSTKLAEYLREIGQHGSMDKERHMYQLNKKRLGRHGDSNKLEQLLEDFQAAQCTEVRDKIYGFLGLAHDCEDSNIVADYSKPVYELYSDIIRFFCRRRLLQEGGTNEVDRAMRLLRFSQIVYRMLQAPKPSCETSGALSSTVYQAKAAVWGSILELGPTYDDMISSSAANKSWKISYKAHYPFPEDRKKLLESNEAYNDILLKMSRAKVDGICGIEPCEIYSRVTPSTQLWYSSGSTTATSYEQWDREYLDIGSDRDMSDEPGIVLNRTDVHQCRMFLGTQSLIGLAPPQAQQGDLICMFWETDATALLRKEDNAEVYRIVGKLDVSKGFLRDDLRPSYLPFLRPGEACTTMDMQLDIKALSVLSS